VLARKILGRVGAAHVLVDPDEIFAFQADGELVWIVGTQQKMLATQTLQALEERLEPQFQRVHRNAIVNVNHVRTISTLSSQRWVVTLSNSSQVVVSKRQARNIRRILNW
jgi:DNA-binding LytR/AlgR family response regulator